MPTADAAPFNSDLMHYAILCVAKGAAWFAERALADACSREATLRDIASGEFARVARVYAFNPAEHVADDVTEEIAIELARRCAPGEPIAPALLDFIEAHAGLAYARGLHAFDRSFAAA